MKKILAAVTAAVMLAPAAAFAEVTDANIDEYTLYSFERGMPTGFNKTGGANTEIVPGYGQSDGAIQVTLGNGSATSSVQMPVYWISGKEYKISFYYKPLDGGSIETIRPLIYDAKKIYDFTEAAFGTERMTDAGGGWYYYSAVYDAGKKPFVTGAGTIELRTTRSNTADNSAYLLDDVIVEPVEGYSNVLFEENFNSAGTGVLSNFGVMTRTNTDTTTEIKTKPGDENDKYVEITGADTSNGAQAGIRNSDSNLFDVSNGTEYRLSFDAAGVSAGTYGKKMMWHLRGKTYVINTDDIALTANGSWNSYEYTFTADGDYAEQYIRPQLASSAAKNGTYAIDNIRLEEAVPGIDSAGIGEAKAGEEFTVDISGSEGLLYNYRIMTSADGINYITADYGTGVSSVSYTPEPADAGKYIKAVVTGYDETHAYNTVETEPKQVLGGAASAEFTSALGTELSGTVYQSEYDSAFAFIAAYDDTGRLLGISTAQPARGETAQLSLSVSEMPAKAKIAVFDSLADLNLLTEEATLQ